MKVKLFLSICLILVTLTGCLGQKSLYFQGITNHWQIKYQANINSQSSESDYTEIRYIGNGHPPTHITFEVGGSSGSMSLHNGILILSGGSCSGCAVTRKTDQITAKIEWDGKSERATLKNKRKFQTPIPIQTP